MEGEINILLERVDKEVKAASRKIEEELKCLGDKIDLNEFINEIQLMEYIIDTLTKYQIKHDIEELGELIKELQSKKKIINSYIQIVIKRKVLESNLEELKKKVDIDRVKVDIGDIFFVSLNEVKDYLKQIGEIDNKNSKVYERIIEYISQDGNYYYLKNKFSKVDILYTIFVLMDETKLDVEKEIRIDKKDSVISNKNTYRNIQSLEEKYKKLDEYIEKFNELSRAIYRIDSNINRDFNESKFIRDTGYLKGREVLSLDLVRQTEIDTNIVKYISDRYEYGIEILLKTNLVSIFNTYILEFVAIVELIIAEVYTGINNGLKPQTTGKRIRVINSLKSYEQPNKYISIGEDNLNVKRDIIKVAEFYKKIYEN